VNEAPESRDTTGLGRARGPNPEEPPEEESSVSCVTQPNAIILTENTCRLPPQTIAKGRERHVTAVRRRLIGEPRAGTLLMRLRSDREAGARSGDSPQRSEGSGAEREASSCGAYRTLHYASAMHSAGNHGSLRPSIANIGVSA
jgi:hypothetical protein